METSYFWLLGRPWPRYAQRKRKTFSCRTIIYQFVVGNVKFSGGICVPQAGRQTNHHSRLLFINVTSQQIFLFILSENFSAGYSCTYFALDSVFGLVVFTVGICHGLACTFIYTIVNGTAQKWFPPEVRGLVASFVMRWGGALYSSLIRTRSSSY